MGKNSMKKTKTPVVFGDLPRDGFVYSLYRGHVMRLGIVVAGLVAILIWAWSGSLVAVRSYVHPTGTAELAALTDQLAAPADDPGGKALPRPVPAAQVLTQHGCYRLEVTFDAVEALPLQYDAVQIYRVEAGGKTFLAAAEAQPPVGAAVKAVLHPAGDKLAYDLRAAGVDGQFSAMLIDLRSVQVGRESTDAVQMLILTPVTAFLLIAWLRMLQDPRRHPMYRQLGRYGATVASVVAMIDREVGGSGPSLRQGDKVIQTPNWTIRRSAFTSNIYKNTAPASAAGEKDRKTNE